MAGKTHSEMRDLLRDYAALSIVRLPDARATEHLDMTISSLCATYMSQHNWHEDYFDLAANLDYYDLEDTVLLNYPHQFYWYKDAFTRVDLEQYINKAELDLAFPDTSDAGEPQAYAVIGRTIWIRPKPNVETRIYREYYRELPPLVGDGDQNGFLKFDWRLVLYKALSEHVASYSMEPARIQEWERIARLYESEFAVREGVRTRSNARPVSEEPG